MRCGGVAPSDHPVTVAWICSASSGTMEVAGGCQIEGWRLKKSARAGKHPSWVGSFDAVSETTSTAARSSSLMVQLVDW